MDITTNSRNLLIVDIYTNFLLDWIKKYDNDLIEEGFDLFNCTLRYKHELEKKFRDLREMCRQFLILRGPELHRGWNNFLNGSKLTLNRGFTGFSLSGVFDSVVKGLYLLKLVPKTIQLTWADPVRLYYRYMWEDTKIFTTDEEYEDYLKDCKRHNTEICRRKLDFITDRCFFTYYQPRRNPLSKLRKRKPITEIKWVIKKKRITNNHN